MSYGSSSLVTCSLTHHCPSEFDSHFSPADQHLEGSSVRARPGHTSCATPWTVPATLLTTGRSSAQSLTANSSEDGTTPGGHTQEWTVGQTVPLN